MRVIVQRDPDDRIEGVAIDEQLLDREPGPGLGNSFYSSPSQLEGVEVTDDLVGVGFNVQRDQAETDPAIAVDQIWIKPGPTIEFDASFRIREENWPKVISHETYMRMMRRNVRDRRSDTFGKPRFVNIEDYPGTAIVEAHFVARDSTRELGLYFLEIDSLFRKAQTEVDAVVGNIAQELIADELI